MAGADEVHVRWGDGAHHTLTLTEARAVVARLWANASYLGSTAVAAQITAALEGSGPADIHVHGVEAVALRRALD